MSEPPTGLARASGTAIACTAGDWAARWYAHEDTAEEAKEELMVVVDEMVGNMMMIILCDINHMGC